MKRRDFIKGLAAALGAAGLPASVAKAAEAFVPEVLPEAVIEKGKWHHVAVVRKSGAMQMFIDGVAVKNDSDILSMKQEEGVTSVNILKGEGCSEPTIAFEGETIEGDFTLEVNVFDAQDGYQSALSDLRLTQVARDESSFLKLPHNQSKILDI